MLTLYKEEEQTIIKENVKLFLESMIERQDDRAWIVLESVRDEEIKFFLGQHEDHCHYLFNDDDVELQEAGAVALCLHNVPEALEWISTHWGKNWFSFFVTKYDVEQVITHLSSLCYLSSNDKMYLFRYYEPATFACWVSGLKEAKRVDEALGLFSEVYVETPLPHMLMQYSFYDNAHIKQAIDLQDNLKGLSLPLPKYDVIFSSLEGCWYMGQKEYEFLAPVALNTFKIKLCKNLAEEHSLLDKYTLTEVYTIINTEVARATKYGMKRKDTLAYFVNIRFEHEDFWNTYQSETERILQKTELDEVDRIEVILKAISDKENNI